MSSQNKNGQIQAGNCETFHRPRRDSGMYGTAFAASKGFGCPRVEQQLGPLKQFSPHEQAQNPDDTAKSLKCLKQAQAQTQAPQPPQTPTPTPWPNLPSLCPGPGSSCPARSCRSSAPPPPRSAPGPSAAARGSASSRSRRRCAAAHWRRNPAAGALGTLAAGKVGLWLWGFKFINLLVPLP